MTWTDKLELDLKEDPPYREDHFSKSQVGGPEIPTGPGRSREIAMERGDENYVQLTVPFEDEQEPHDG